MVTVLSSHAPNCGTQCFLCHDFIMNSPKLTSLSGPLPITYGADFQLTFTVCVAYSRISDSDRVIVPARSWNPSSTSILQSVALSRRATMALEPEVGPIACTASPINVTLRPVSQSSFTKCSGTDLISSRAVSPDDYHIKIYLTLGCQFFETFSTMEADSALGSVVSSSTRSAAF